MVRAVSSAFYERMQEDGLRITTLIDLETTNGDYHWTGNDQEIWYTLSGTNTKYEPFPGQTLDGLRQSNDLGVSVIDFVVANTGGIIGNLLTNNDLDYAVVKVGRVFADTPGLGRMDVFEGRLGDHAFTREAISGQARNRWGSALNRWPYYNYQDKCAWAFGGTGCGFNTSSVTLVYSVDDLNVGSSTTLNLLLTSGTISASYSNGYFDFGRLTVTGGVNSGQVRTIRVHTGDLLALSHRLPINSLSLFNFNIFPGCRKRRIADCRSKYNNDENFLGFPWIPIQEDAF
jgi:uncharacterized phage protein (TIGR02218 family)